MSRMDEMLRRPVAELVVPEAQIRLAESTVGAWEVDPSAARALTVLGLPVVDLSGFIPAEEPDPEIHTLRDGTRGYGIGSFAHQDVYLVPDTGHVVGQPEDPDLGAGAFINSSAEKYVESAWRYFWLQRLLGTSLTEETYEALDQFLARITEIDPLVGTDPEKSMWPAVVSGW
jgi:hypothetical protein